MRYFLTFVLLISIHLSLAAVHPNPKCLFKKENFEFECFPDIMDKVKGDDKFKNTIDKCLQECKGEDKVKDIPDFPKCRGEEMTDQHKEMCGNTYKWMSLFQRCFRREFGVLCNESKEFQEEKIDEFIDKLAADSKKEEIKEKIVKPCLEEIKDVTDDWLKMHHFDCCMLHQGKDVCKEMMTAWVEFAEHAKAHS